MAEAFGSGELKHAPFPLSIFANKCSDCLYSHTVAMHACA